VENVRAYWEWAVDHQEEVEIGEALDSLWLFYDMGSGYQEGLNVFLAGGDHAARQSLDSGEPFAAGESAGLPGALVSALDRFQEAELLLRESRRILSDYDVPGNLAFVCTG